MFMGWSKLGVMFAVLACAAGMAAAQTVQIRDAVTGENENGVPPGFYLTGTGAITSATIGVDEFFRDVFTGTFDIEYDLGLGAGWQALLTYCLEVNQQIGIGVHTPDNTPVGLPYELEPLTAFPGMTGADQVALETLWSNAFGISTISRTSAAAFQSIAWELAMDSTVDFLAGSFQLDENDPEAAAVIAQADAWYDNIENGTWTTRTELMLLVNPESQDLIIPIPEPATLSLLLLGAGAVLRRRTR